MQSPTITIMGLLNSASWTATNPAKTDIAWSLGKPEDPTTRFNTKMISAEFSFLTVPKEKRSLIRSRAHAIVTADFWQDITPEKTMAAMFATRQNIIDEVEALIEANERTLTGLDFAYVAVIRNLDRESERYLRTQFEIVCLYQT